MRVNSLRVKTAAQNQGARVPRSAISAVLGMTAVAVVVLIVGASAAGAAGIPTWTITSVSGPTDFAPGGSEDQYTVTATNTGGAATDGSPVTIADTLPAGVTATSVVGGDVFSSGLLSESASCELTTVTCSFSGAFEVGDSLIMTVTVSIGSSVSHSVTNMATVSGGGATSVSGSEPTTISSTPASFGLAEGSFRTALSTTQAGAHPNLTTSFAFNSSSTISPAGQVKDVNVDLPPGIVGSATAVPKCSMSDVQADRCPSDAMVGVATVAVDFAGGLTRLTVAEPVYNINPYADEPAALGFVALGKVPVRLDVSVRSNGDYGLHVTASDITEDEPILASAVTLWGVPAEHNGPGVSTFDQTESLGNPLKFGGPGHGLRTPFLTNPTMCGGPLTTGLSVDSWPSSEGGVLQASQTSSASSSLSAPTGCDVLSFAPSTSVRPDTFQSGIPASYSVDLEVPQNENPAGLATPNVKDVVVTLPQGTVISPSASNGLQSCSDKASEPAGTAGNQFGFHSLAPASCPAASQVGAVLVKTPLLASPLEGQVFVGEPTCAPCTADDAREGRMIRLFLQIQGSGVIVKLEGSTSLNQSTGQLTTTFANNPELPFEKLELRLNGGPRAPLANPSTCGVPLAATSQLTPYSSETVAEPSSEPFEVTGCSSPRFNPSFSAGTINNQAGAFSPFSVTFSRTDQDQDLHGSTVQTPPGLLGILRSVARCPEPQASQGTCGPESVIGHVTTGAGPGTNPFYLGGGVFLTGPYKGATFGLSIVVPAV